MKSMKMKNYFIHEDSELRPYPAVNGCSLFNAQVQLNTKQCINCSKIRAIDWKCFTNIRRWSEVPSFEKAIFPVHVRSTSPSAEPNTPDVLKPTTDSIEKKI